MAESAEIVNARQALGRQLAAYREAAGYTQQTFAPLTHYSRSTVGNVETGRQSVSREFWERCDELLEAEGALLATYDRLSVLIQQHRREQTARTHARSDRSLMAGSTEAAAAWHGIENVQAGSFCSGNAVRTLPPRGAPSVLPVAPELSWADGTYAAVLNPMDAARRALGRLLGEGVNDLPSLRRTVDQAMQVSLSSDYGALEESLPGLIGWTEAAAMHAGSRDDLAIQTAISDVYAVAGWTLIKADNPVGAWIAAQRSRQAAEHVGDVLRIASATRCLAEAHMRARDFEEATRTALLATVYLQSAAPEDRQVALSLRGAALLSAAASSARRGDSREAHAALQAGAACAAELGQDRADLATVFGPTNVAIHQVAVAIELGDARAAVRHIPAVQLDRLPTALTERRARFLIDVARSYAQVGDDTAAIDALLQAEAIAADELRCHRLTRELIPQLLTREHRSSDLRGLAARCNLLA